MKGRSWGLAIVETEIVRSIQQPPTISLVMGNGDPVNNADPSGQRITTTSVLYELVLVLRTPIAQYGAYSTGTACLGLFMAQNLGFATGPLGEFAGYLCTWIVGSLVVAASGVALPPLR